LTAITRRNPARRIPFHVTDIKVAGPEGSVTLIPKSVTGNDTELRPLNPTDRTLKLNTANNKSHHWTRPRTSYMQSPGFWGITPYSSLNVK
jgi:hypothetical protein